MASLSTIDIAKMEPVVFYPALNLSNCSGGGSKANMGGGFVKTYQPIMEAFDRSYKILFKVIDCSDHPQIPWDRASDRCHSPLLQSSLTIIGTCVVFLCKIDGCDRQKF